MDVRDYIEAAVKVAAIVALCAGAAALITLAIPLPL